MRVDTTSLEFTQDSSKSVARALYGLRRQFWCYFDGKDDGNRGIWSAGMDLKLSDGLNFIQF